MARRTDPSAAVVRAVRVRDMGACARCGTDQSLTTQHRVARGMGGSRAAWINEPGNLITLCGSGTTGCHGWVESHPADANRTGMSVRRPWDPAAVPVLTWRGWLLLDNEGGWQPAAAPELIGATT